MEQTMEHQTCDFNWKIAYERLVSRVTDQLDLMEDAVLSGEISCAALYKIIKKLLRDEQTRTLETSQLQSQFQSCPAQSATIFKALTFNAEETLNKNVNVQESLNAVSAPDVEIEIIDMENVNVENIDLDAEKMENENGTESQREEENCVEKAPSLEIEEADAEANHNLQFVDTQIHGISDAHLEPNQNQLEQEEKESSTKTGLSKKLFKCPECPYRAKWKANVKTHLKHVHLHQPRAGSSQSRRFPCPHSGCNYAVKQKSQLTRHMTTHSSEKPIFCSHPNCNYSTKQIGNLKIHTRTHTGEKPYVCQFQFCSFAAKTSGQLVDHSRKHTKEKPFKCPEPNCEHSARSSSSLTSHRQNHLSKRMDLKEVTDCPSFQCPDCEYSAKTTHLLSSHLKTHSLEKPFACSFESCEYRCKHKASLSTHLKTHSDEKQYKCELCPFRGKTRGSVQIHIKNVHADPKSWTFKCKEPKCDFKSRTKAHLQRHHLTHSEKKKYACQFPGCDYLSLVKKNVKLHEYNIHTLEKREKCGICDYKCKVKSVLTVHMRTHTKEEPYKCKENGCDYRAKQASVLKHHQEKYHPQI